MTHTEESLMALVNEAINSAEAAERDHCSPMGSPSFRYSNAQAREDEAALRLALREVLAERDRYLDIIRREAWLEHASENDVESPYVPFTDWVAEKKRAERAEAECEVIRKRIAELEAKNG